MGRSISTIKRFIILTLVLVLSVVLALCFGSVKSFDSLIIFGLRLPRVLAAALAGAALSVSGLLLQSISGNSLCAPNIIGINAGAGFGIMLLNCFAPGLWRLSTAAAFAGALVAAFAVIMVASGAGGEISKYTLILAGVAVSALFNAGISFLILRFPEAASNYSSFSLGSFSGVSLKELFTPAVICAAAIIAAFVFSPRIKLMLLGDGIAASMGVNVRSSRMACVVIAAALAAGAVSFAGLLGFVGLAVPHITRKFFGEDIKTNIAACILGGAALTILSDLIGRVIAIPSELPAGVITAVLGAPFFIYLIVSGKNRR